jgi:hypothetical protein
MASRVVRARLDDASEHALGVLAGRLSAQKRRAVDDALALVLDLRHA